MRAFDRSRPSVPALIETAAREAGALALGAYRRANKSWAKLDGTPVSDADLAVNALLKERLTAAFPDYGWLSEETSDTPDRLARDRVWVVDPIDGTSAFLSGDPGWCVALTLVERGRPVAGGVFRPVDDQYYSAEAGGGAWLNGRRIRCSDRSRLEGSSLIVKPRVLKLDIWDRPWPELKVKMTPSIALRLCQIASGAGDASFGMGPKSDWDLAAGDLIVHEAGGRMSDLGGQIMVYNRPETRQNGFLAAAPGLFEELKERTRSVSQGKARGGHGRKGQGA